MTIGVTILTVKVISAAFDFTIAYYPILILWKVQLDLRTKVGLCCMMCLGVLYDVPLTEG